MATTKVQRIMTQPIVCTDGGFLSEPYFPVFAKCILYMPWQGDFLVHFLDRARDELVKRPIAISVEKLQERLTLVGQLSNLATKDAVSHNGQLRLGLATSTVGQEFSSQGASGSTTGSVACFPCHFRRALTKYQLIFRHLFHCKQPGGLIHSSYNFTLLCPLSTNVALHTNYQHYMTFEVLEPDWHVMEGKLQAAKCTNGVMLQHNAFPDKCLKECMLCWPQIFEGPSDLVADLRGRVYLGDYGYALGASLALALIINMPPGIQLSSITWASGSPLKDPAKELLAAEFGAWTTALSYEHLKLSHVSLQEAYISRVFRASSELLCKVSLPGDVAVTETAVTTALGLPSGQPAQPSVPGAVDKHPMGVVFLFRFSGEHYEKNEAFFDKLEKIAGRRGATPGQLALAWVHHQGEDVVPIPGTTKVKNRYLEENIDALKIELTPEEIREIEDAVPHEDIEGTRYPDMSFTFIDTPPLSIAVTPFWLSETVLFTAKVF